MKTICRYVILETLRIESSTFAECTIALRYRIESSTLDECTIQLRYTLLDELFTQFLLKEKLHAHALVFTLLFFQKNPAH